MARFFFDINGNHDEIGVDLDDLQEAILDARKTVLRLAEYDDACCMWTCLIRNTSGNSLHRIELRSIFDVSRIGMNIFGSASESQIVLGVVEGDG